MSPGHVVGVYLLTFGFGGNCTALVAAVRG